MASNYKFVIEGKEKEKKFAELFKSVEFSTCKEDRQEKWDVKIISKVDVKGLKKIDRTNKDYNENWHWIELQGNAGNPGWLFGGADYFAFETFNYWMVVSKTELQRFIKKHVTSKKVLTTKTPYKLYQRKGKKDLITLVSSIDLCYLADAIIHKNEPFIKKPL